MSTVIDELVTILGIELEPKTQAKLKSFNNLLGKSTKFALGLGAALTTAASAAGILAEQSASSAHSMAKFSKLTGISTDELQEWEMAMVSSGGSATNMRSDLKGLLESMSSPIPGEFNHALFMLGVNAKDSSGNVRDIGDVLKDVSEKMKKYSPQQQMVWGKQLGLSGDTVKLLKKGAVGLKKALKEARESGAIMSPAQIQAGSKFIILLEKTKRVVKIVRRELAASLLPILSKNLKMISKWIKLNREWIKLKIEHITKGVADGFKKFWAIINKVLGAFREFSPGLRDVADKLLSVKNISAAVQVAMVAMAASATATALAWLPLIAGAAAFFLIVEDIIAFTEGRESYTGDFVTGFQKFFASIKEKFPALSGAFGEFLLLMRDIAVVFAQLTREGLGALLEDTKIFVQVLTPLVDKLLSLIEAGTPGALKDWIAGAREKVSGEDGPSAIKAMLGALPIIGPAMTAHSALGGINRAAQQYGSQSSVTAGAVNHIKADIHVNGVGQPQEVADRVYAGVGNTIATATSGG